MKQDKSREKQMLRGETGFENYYSSLFPGRWAELKKSLMEDTKHAAVTFPGCTTYFLDPASVCASLCLPVSNAGHVLDLCAAPGGKTLVISANLSSDADMKSNERSPDRKKRLAKVIEDSLPESISSRISVSCSDGATMCRNENQKYGSILLDAPCSSERHVMKDPKYLSQWSPARLKNLATEQWALASSAWRMLENGGFLLYATCALSPKENDEIILRLTKKFEGALIQDMDVLEKTFSENLSSALSKNIEIKSLSEKSIEEIFRCAEPTGCGMHVLPDTSGGYGPLYFSLIKKQ
ncbi:MAG: RsmB/NOP family class I SAM-dependent RNA methyltransferase [Treponema sp.]|nr:RsmB/NOP family class I SAM-dependent RNA methyltransferase [Treponema sp.]